MFLIRPTASLAKRMKIKLQSNEAPSNTILGDWSAIDLHINRQQIILSVCEKARLGIICKAAPYTSWPERFLKSLSDFLQAIGIDKEKIQNEIALMANPQFAKNYNRSVLGSINDYRGHLEYRLLSGRNASDDYLDLSLQLSETPVSVFKYKYPKEVAIELFGSKTSKQRPNLRLV